MSVEQPMKCPRCDSQMTSGVVVGRSPGVKFKPKRDVLGDLGGIVLTQGIFNHSVEAQRCAGCGVVLILPATKAE